ncbi:hypothetical protein L3X38_022105 [Prunus dulcis]|uniref:Uncharacterized protein n=1 Tax=Prunus dulcis TaxID=3755 RepID=A0AAD4VWK5_PRUDU|nr:hypothetical protein L3X38_022105 [Prunus dulcis]
MLLHHKLVSTYPELKSSNQLAIISPCRGQVERLKQRFRSTYGVEFEKLVEITTVDGCQSRKNPRQREAVRNDDVDNHAPSDNLWDVDQAQEDDNEFGVGDMDMDDGSCSHN